MTNHTPIDMLKISLTSLAIASLALAGCAAPAPEAAPAVVASTTTTTTTTTSKQVCHREIPTGSTIAVTKCISAEQAAADAKAVDAAKNQIGYDAGVAGMQHAPGH